MGTAAPTGSPTTLHPQAHPPQAHGHPNPRRGLWMPSTSAAIIPRRSGIALMSAAVTGGLRWAQGSSRNARRLTFLARRRRGLLGSVPSATVASPLPRVLIERRGRREVGGREVLHDRVMVRWR